ncbi:MAG TPA: glycine cleavage T C-terminal barrel domain-containing protein [Planctomycetota bacterium]|nr:glycine cleavage T C-terminal barrel domain-containing protein [Planctomycetota bacterium]
MPTLQEALKASGGIVNRGGLPLRFGDVDDEENALREGAALTPISWRGVLEVTGKDRIRFLHNATTNDVFKLVTGREGGSIGKDEKLDLAATPSGLGQFSVIPNRQGKMVADIRLRLLEDRAWVDLDRGSVSNTVTTLGGMVVSEDVQIKDRSKEFDLLRVDGPKAREVLAKALGTIPDLPDWHFARIGDVLVSPFAITGAPGYDLQVPAAASGDLWTKLVAAGAKPCGFFAMETGRVENGFPRWVADMDGTVLPMEAGLDPIAISYSKGCYLGQEVIQRVKTYSEAPRALVQVAIDPRPPGKEGGPVPTPNPGTAVLVEKDTVGRVTSLAWSRKFQGLIALALVKKEHKAEGTKVVLDAGGAPYTGRVRPLPWHAKFAPAAAPTPISK